MYILQAIFTEDLPYFRVKVNKKKYYSIYLIDTYSQLHTEYPVSVIKKCQKEHGLQKSVWM